VRGGQPVDIAGLKLSVREIVDDILGEGTILYNLNSMKGMDEYTFVHALHICILAIELGRRVHFDEAQLEELGVATLLHDVGKIFVPLEVLRKPARLDDSEFAVISRHPVDGAIALARETGVPEVAAVVAFEHHVHIDHSGYPRLRRPRPLHMYSLMASIADVYDALTTARPYRPPLPPLQAVEVLRMEYSSRLEPRLLRHFLAMLGPYPCGTLVGLSDDRMAVVTRPNAMAPGNPFARIIERSGPAHRMADAEVPLRDLAPDPASLTTLDPVTLGMDLTALLHSSIPASAIRKPGASALT
jgi:HD-GYP domain-containing protein (c-di-GMP phosphodiesterase class II)